MPRVESGAWEEESATYTTSIYLQALRYYLQSHNQNGNRAHEWVIGMQSGHEIPYTLADVHCNQRRMFRIGGDELQSHAIRAPAAYTQLNRGGNHGSIIQ